MKKAASYFAALIIFLFISSTMILAKSGDAARLDKTLSSPPSIASFSPISGPIGSKVTIMGSDFNILAAKNIVYFGPVKAMVNSATLTSLEVTAPAGAAYAPITVTTGSLTAYSALSFTPTFPSCRVIDQQAFAAKVDFKVWGSIGSIAAGDLDNDGKIDLATTSNMGITIFRNKGQGLGIDSTLFVERVDLPSLTADDWITNIVLVDMNGDGMLDVVTVLRSSNCIAAFLNTSSPGAVSFGQRTDFATGTMPQEAAAGDLDGDGRPDIVVSNSAGGWGTTISVLHNKSVGDTIDLEHFELFSGNAPYGVCLRDIDGDLLPDIVVANKNSSYISIFRNISTPGSLEAGSFAAKADFLLPQGGGAYHIAPCDVDGDGRTDLALAQGGGGLTILSLLKNASTVGSLSFAPQVVLSVPKDSRDVAAGDLDGDGKSDLALCSWEENAMSVMRNVGEAGGITAESFPERIDCPAGTNPTCLLIADFDLDNRPDIIVGNFNDGTISIFRNVVAPPATEVAASFPIMEKLEYRLFKNYPNPFNSTTKIAYQIPVSTNIQLRVFDVKGHLLQTLVDGEQQAGYYEAEWNGDDESGLEAPSGVYFFKLEANNFTQTCRTVLLK